MKWLRYSMSFRTRSVVLVCPSKGTCVRGIVLCIICRYDCFSWLCLTSYLNLIVFVGGMRKMYSFLGLLFVSLMMTRKA